MPKASDTTTDATPAPLPKLGDIVLLHTEGGDVPMLVTAVLEDSVNGQSFLTGTARDYVENAKPGDEPGQFSAKG